MTQHPYPKKCLATCLLVPLGLSLLATTTHAADWPQWRGPNRDGLSSETGLLQQWPAAGPTLLWQTNDLGDGYGAPAVVGNRIYLVSNQGLDSESVQALDAENGKEIWATRIGNVGNPDQRPNFPAARSTPTVVENNLFVLSSDGDLACLNRETGDPIWTLNLRAEFNGKPGSWAYAESPLVDGDLVICAPGGPDASIVAVQRNTGKTVWKTAIPECDAAGYTSTLPTQAGGVKQYVAFLGHALVGVEAKTGKLLWQYEKTKGQANMPTPVAREDLVFSTTNRAPGALLKLVANQDQIQAEEVYSSKDLPNAIGGFVVVGDLMFGTSAQYLICAEFKTGNVLWRDASIAPGSVCFADGRLFLHGENGEVALVAASAESYKELGRVTPPNAPEPISRMQKAWAYPALANGKLFIRNRSTLWCYAVK